MSSLFPITVVVALAIFITKEIIEFIKRARNDRKKLEAYKLLLSDEIEKNNWFIKSIKRTLGSIKEYYETCDIFLKTTPAGEIRINFESKSDEGSASWPIPETSRKIFEKIFADLPVIDEKLFILSKEAYESVSELEHIRRSLIEHVTDDDGHLESFVEYALEEVESAHLKLSSLYKACTGNDLKDFKLRSFT